MGRASSPVIPGQGNGQEIPSREALERREGGRLTLGGAAAVQKTGALGLQVAAARSLGESGPEPRCRNYGVASTLKVMSGPPGQQCGAWGWPGPPGGWHGHPGDRVWPQCRMWER